MRNLRLPATPLTSAAEADSYGFLLAAPMPHAAHAFGTRYVGETPDAAFAHAEAILGGEVASMNQIHGAVLQEATHGGVYGPCDALYTTAPDLWLAVKTADCTPVLISSSKAVAAVHLGWRSVQGGLLGVVVRHLTEALGQLPTDLHLRLGPALSQPNFEVEETFIPTFGVAAPQRFFRPSGKTGHVLMDLSGIIRAQATALGVPPEHIATLSHCTFAKPDVFFSYRKDKAEGVPSIGRQISLICRQ